MHTACSMFGTFVRFDCVSHLLRARSEKCLWMLAISFVLLLILSSSVSAGCFVDECGLSNSYKQTSIISRDSGPALLKLLQTNKHNIKVNVIGVGN